LKEIINLGSRSRFKDISMKHADICLKGTDISRKHTDINLESTDIMRKTTDNVPNPMNENATLAHLNVVLL
jgi:hypothetical protein